MALGDMAADAERACDFLKALTNPSRLMILCQLAEGEKSVGQLEELLRLRQPTLSQQLARLREDRLVETSARRQDGPLPAGEPGGAAADRAALRAVLRPGVPISARADTLRVGDDRQGAARPRSP